MTTTGEPSREPPEEPGLGERPAVRLVVDREAVQGRVAELGAELRADYQGVEPILVSVLRGGVVFLADLVRAAAMPCLVDFMAISRFDASEDTGVVRIVRPSAWTAAGGAEMVVDFANRGRRPGRHRPGSPTPRPRPGVGRGGETAEASGRHEVRVTVGGEHRHLSARPRGEAGDPGAVAYLPGKPAWLPTLARSSPSATPTRTTPTPSSPCSTAPPAGRCGNYPGTCCRSAGWRSPPPARCSRRSPTTAPLRLGAQGPQQASRNHRRTDGH